MGCGCKNTWPVLLAIYILAFCHTFVGTLSICIGIAASVNADVWMAHRVSPIWSGGFFLITAVVGIACGKTKTVYLIMCFGAFSVVSLVTAVISIQLLRLGLVNHMSDGDAIQKEDKDQLVIFAMATAGTEIVICIITPFISFRMAKRAKLESERKSEGTFSVQVRGDNKDIVIHSTHDRRYGRLVEDPTMSFMGEDDLRASQQLQKDTTTENLIVQNLSSKKT